MVSKVGSQVGGAGGRAQKCCGHWKMAVSVHREGQATGFFLSGFSQEGRGGVGDMQSELLSQPAL